MSDKAQLTQFTLKLAPETLTSIKVLTATDNDFQYQYEVFDAAVVWAINNVDELVALANCKTGKNRSYYLGKSVELLNELENNLSCNTTRALYTAIISYLKQKKIEM